jgi:hypothetical protein
MYFRRMTSIVSVPLMNIAIIWLIEIVYRNARGGN